MDADMSIPQQVPIETEQKIETKAELPSRKVSENELELAETDPELANLELEMMGYEGEENENKEPIFEQKKP